MKKNFVLILIIVIFIASITSGSYAITGNNKINWLINEGLVTGYPDGTYGLENAITRAEVSAMITRALDGVEISDVLLPVQGRFRDVFPTHWANGYINYVASMGFVNGYPDTTFKPSNNITYSEVIKILVMINGDIPDTTGYQGATWATPYIIKAIETGIMDGIIVDNGDYGRYATRGRVFEMIYNTLMISYSEKTEDYTAIVIGNPRTSRLSNNEVLLTVIDSGDESGRLEYNYKKGDTFTLKITSDKDTEDLLGKVVRLNLNKDGSLIRITVDSSYEYYIGPVLTNEDYIMINTGEVFDVISDARTSRISDKLYAFYYNDKEFDYLDFIHQYDATDGNIDGSYVTEFSRITFRDGIVFFIDSYDFDDIAPVVTIEDSGRIINLYNDQEILNAKKVSLKSVYGFYGDRFENIELKDILAEDVIHIYGNKGIVKMDAAYSGQYKGIEESSEVAYALINRQYFQIRSTDYKKPVYSLDGTNFSTLESYEAYDLLEPLEGRRVVFLIDLNQSLQMISQYY